MAILAARRETCASSSGERAMASHRIEILFLIDYFHRTGGTEKHLAQLISGLCSDRFRCSVVAFDLGANPLLDDLRARGVPIISMRVGREYVPNAFIQAWRLSRLIRANGYDIVQTFHQKADTYGAVIAWLSGAKHLISSKRDTGHFRRPWHRFLNRHLQFVFDAFIVVAEAVRTAVIASDHLPASRITTIYNGVDVTRFAVPSAEQRSDARARFSFSASDFVVGMVAGFRPEKNHDVFFSGLLQAVSSIPSLRVLAVGAGPLLVQLREATAGTALGARTVFPGDVPDVVPYLWSMDVGCLTPGSNEGFSNAVVEQMSVGLPMVVTDVGGNAEAVVDGMNGRVIPPLDSGAIARVLIDLHGDPERRASMGRASRRRVEERFALGQMCTAHAKLYLSLCNPVRTADPETRMRDR
jgi:glycosyltransferase involved in cell wall biosynthesis